MAAGTTPIFPDTPKVGFAKVTAANTSSNGDGNITTPTMFLAFTAGADGSFISKVRWNLTATASVAASTATNGRIYLSTVNSGATTGGTDTWLIADIALPSLAVGSAGNPGQSIDVPLNIAIASGYYVLVSNHNAPAANSQWQAIVLGGDY